MKREYQKNSYSLSLILIVILLSIIFVIMLFYLVISNNDSKVLGIVTSTLPIGQTSPWDLIFSDEFNGTSFDSTKWVPAFPWGNTSSTTQIIAYRSENDVVSNGTLKLLAKKESV